MIERIARAKINLALHVTGQRTDGYHLLDTLVVFAEHGDRIMVGKPDHPHGPIAISVGGPFGDSLSAGPENLVSSAALLLRNSLLNEGMDPAPVEIHLEKNLPVASGIGGGSADAAAALLALKAFWQTDFELTELAAAIGADVPMCLRSSPLLASGIGDQICDLELAAPLHLVLVNPLIEVSTPKVFNALKTKENMPMAELGNEVFPDVPELLVMRNDLQVPAISVAPEIGEVLEAIDRSGARLARMSGSGATCFGIFDTATQAESARDEINRAHPDWWCVATSTSVS